MHDACVCPAMRKGLENPLHRGYFARDVPRHGARAGALAVVWFAFRRCAAGRVECCHAGAGRRNPVHETEIRLNARAGLTVCNWSNVARSQMKPGSLVRWLSVMGAVALSMTGTASAADVHVM